MLLLQIPLILLCIILTRAGKIFKQNNLSILLRKRKQTFDTCPAAIYNITCEHRTILYRRNCLIINYFGCCTAPDQGRKTPSSAGTGMQEKGTRYYVDS
jgi:hypothetical protein